MSTDNQNAVADFEHYPPDMPMDETDVNLRGYLDKFSDEKLAEYDPSWTDEQVLEWEENFRNDGGLMLVCCERDVDMQEYREVLELLIEFRKKHITSSG